MKQAGIINRIHKGLRTWLFETGIKIQETDFLTAEEGLNTITTLKKVLQVADRKSFIDENHLLPVMVLYAPYLVSLMDAENLKTREIIVKLTGYIDNYLQPGTEGFYAITGFSIQQVYSEFMGSVLIYMNRLEKMLNEMYAAADQEEITEMLDAAQYMQIDAANRMIIEEWIFKGLSNREIDELMKNGRKMPAEWMKAGLVSISNQRAGSKSKKQLKTTGSVMAAA